MARGMTGRAHRLGLAVLALLAGCAGPPRVDPAGPDRLATRHDPRIDTRHEASSQSSRVEFVILHYTTIDLAASLRVLTEEPVSSHYLVDDRPPYTVYRLVGEDRRAHHAGASQWAGRSQLNGTSIGIEIVNRGLVTGPDGVARFEPYPEGQIEQVVALVRDIVERHGVRPDRILGHADIAPGRKIDPGPLFPWQRLADAGLVAWPDAARVAALRSAFEALPRDTAWFQATLAEVGYGVPQSGAFDTATRDALAAFQMRFRPAKYDGTPDAETAALLAALAEMRR